MIDPRAVIDPSAEIDATVHVGPFAVIGPKVHLGPETWVGPHVVISGPTSIGRGNRIYQFASVGEAPQDQSYRGEETRLVIGDHNVIRESATISRGTAKGLGETRIGDHNLIMAYVHIAHDCVVGNHVIFSNAASLAGHCEVQDHCTLGGFTLVHQFCRIGAHAFTSMGAALNRDLPPFCLASGNYARLIGINKIGLRRRGIDEASIAALHRAFVELLRTRVGAKARMNQYFAEAQHAEVRQLISFIQQSTRGILRVGRD